MKKKILFIILFSIIIISIVSYFLFFYGKCRSDSDCIVNDCCNPTECVLDKGELDCSSILVCEETPPEVNCACIKGKCVTNK